MCFTKKSIKKKDATAFTTLLILDISLKQPLRVHLYVGMSHYLHPHSLWLEVEGEFPQPS